MNKYVLASYKHNDDTATYADFIFKDTAYTFVDLMAGDSNIDQIHQLHDGLQQGQVDGVMVMHFGAIADLDEALRDGCGMVERASVASHICIDLMQMIEDGYSKPQLISVIEEIISTLIGDDGLAELKGGDV